MKNQVNAKEGNRETREKGGKNIVFLFLLLSYSLIGCSASQTIFSTKNSSAFLPLIPPHKVETLVLEDNSAQRHLLDNGMVVITKEIPNHPVIALEVWVKSGSAAEGKFTGSGISHLVEHMLFKGTGKRGVGEIEREIKSCGGQIGGFTSSDYTAYRIVVPSDYFEKALYVLADAITNPSFDKNELEKEKNVILREISLNRDDPKQRLLQIFYPISYSIHPYRNPVIGYENLLKGLSREDLIEYHNSTYGPDNLIFVVAGGVDPAASLLKINSAFENFARKSSPPVILPTEPEQLCMREIKERRDVRVGYLLLGFHGVSMRNKDAYPLDVLAIILGQGENSRLNRRLCRDKNLAYSIDVFNHTPQDPGIFGVFCLTEENKSEDTVSSIMEEIERIKKYPVGEKELKKAKRTVLSRYIFEREDVADQAKDLALGEIIAGDYNFSEQYVKSINSVNPEDIRQAANKYFKKENMTITVILPKESSSVDSDSSRVKTNDVQISQIQKSVLSNGLVTLLKKDQVLPIVSIKAVFLGGLRSENESTNGICNLTGRMLLKGTKSRNSEYISDFIELHGIEISTFSGNNSFGISLKVPSENLAEAIWLLGDILTNSIFPMQEILIEKERLYGEIRQQEDDIFETGSRLLRETLFKSHPYRFQAIGTKDSIGRIEREDIIKFYGEYCRPNNMVLAMFGDIDSENEILDNVKMTFGTWTTGKVAKDFDIPMEPPQNEIRETTNLTEKEQALLMLGFRTVDIYNKDRYTFDLITSILSQQGGRLYDRIREQKGLAYSLGTYSFVGVDPGYYVFYVATIPSRTDEVKNEILREIELLKTDYVSEEEINIAKESLIGNHTIRLQTNSSLAFEASLDELYGIGYDNYLQYDGEINAVSKEDIVRVATKYFDLNKYAIIKIMPENYSQETSTLNLRENP